MKWILTLILSLYFLQVPMGYAGDIAEPAMGAAQTTLPVKSDIQTVNASGEPEDKVDQEYANAALPLGSTDKNVSVNDGAVKASQETPDWAKWQTIINGLGLVLILCATCFAFGAWMAGRGAVKVGQADAAPNLHIKNFKHSAVLFDKTYTLTAHRLRDLVICSIEFEVENRGRTVAKDVTVKMRAKIKANDDREIVEEIAVKGFERHLIPEPAWSESNTQSLYDMPAHDDARVSQGFGLPYGEAIIFDDDTVTGFRISRIEIELTLKYKTTFGEDMTINQVFGIRAMQRDGIVARITRIQKDE